VTTAWESAVRQLYCNGDGHVWTLTDVAEPVTCTGRHPRTSADDRTSDYGSDGCAPARMMEPLHDLPYPTAKLCKVDNPDDRPLSAEEVCRVLRAAPVPAGSVVGSDPRSVPDEPGLYAWWAVPGALPGVPTAAHPSLSLGLVYIGIASTSLRQRIVRQHLAANTGSSTFRLTLASHLLVEGGLTPYRKGKKVLLPRGQLDWLLGWQVSHLYVSWVARQDPAEVEAAVIAAMEPPLTGTTTRATLTGSSSASSAPPFGSTRMVLPPTSNSSRTRRSHVPRQQPLTATRADAGGRAWTRRPAESTRRTLADLRHVAFVS
jgi:hypothetical protein